ncbi:MAG: protein phosphatase 2C domain-containing protein [Candidatus Margulisiibacteriota bacterium]
MTEPIKKPLTSAQRFSRLCQSVPKVHSQRALAHLSGTVVRMLERMTGTSLSVLEQNKDHLINGKKDLFDIWQTVRGQIEKAALDLLPENPSILGNSTLAKGEIRRFAAHGVFGVIDQAVRPAQEDVIGTAFTKDGSLLLVGADGIGGQPDGARAARLAVEAVLDKDYQDLSLGDQIAAARDKLNIANAGKKPEDMMGTTLAAARINPARDQVAVSHVGDSRVYIVRAEGTILLLTLPRINLLSAEKLMALAKQKHNLELIYKDLNPSEIKRRKDQLIELSFADSPFSEEQVRFIDDLISRVQNNMGHLKHDLNHLQFSLGNPGLVPVREESYDLRPGDTVLIATDGMTLSPAEIRAIFGLGLSLEATIKQLVADSAGGDNTSVLGYRRPALPLKELEERLSLAVKKELSLEIPVDIEEPAPAIPKEEEPAPAVPKPDGRSSFVDQANLAEDVDTIFFLQSRDVDPRQRGENLLYVLGYGGEEEQADVIEALSEKGILLSDLPSELIGQTILMVHSSTVGAPEQRAAASRNLEAVLDARELEKTTRVVEKPEPATLSFQEAKAQLRAIEAEIFENTTAEKLAELNDRIDAIRDRSGNDNRLEQKAGHLLNIIGIKLNRILDSDQK